MKIRKLIVGTSMLLCVFTISATKASAEKTNAKSEVRVDITSGELELVAARPLVFGEIKYSSTKQSIPAKINNLSSYSSVFLEPLPPGWTGGSYNPSLIDIKDDRTTGDHTWQLVASMAPLKNTATGSEITDAKLILKNPTDHYNKLVTSNIPISLKSNNRAVPIIDAAPNYGQGRHAISFFNNLDIVGKKDQNYAISPGPYTTNDITLEIPSGTSGQEGSLSTEITWTLTDTPGEYPIEVE